MKKPPLLAVFLFAAVFPLACMAQRTAGQVALSIAETNSLRATHLSAIGQGDRLSALEAILLKGLYGNSDQERLQYVRARSKVLDLAIAGYTAKDAVGLKRLGYPLMDVLRGDRQGITERHAWAFRAERVVVATVLDRYGEDREDGLRTSIILRVDDPILGPDSVGDHLIVRMWSGPSPDDGSMRILSTDPEIVINEQYLVGLSNGRYQLGQSSIGLVPPRGPGAHQLVMFDAIHAKPIMEVKPRDEEIYREVGDLRRRAQQGR